MPLFTKKLHWGAIDPSVEHATMRAGSDRNQQWEKTFPGNELGNRRRPQLLTERRWLRQSEAWPRFVDHRLRLSTARIQRRPGIARAVLTSALPAPAGYSILFLMAGIVSAVTARTPRGRRCHC